MLPLQRSFLRLLLSALVGLTLLSACGGDSEESSSSRGGWGGRGGGQSSTPSVEAVEARFGGLPLQERMSGTVRATNQVAIYPEIDAPITRVVVQTGDYVETGDPLVRLRADTYRERVRQAEAQLRIAEAEAQSARANLAEQEAQLKRTQRLADQNFESAQQLETVQARVESARASVAQADAQVEQAQATLDERRADLRRTVVRAPFSGYVGNRNAEVGQRVNGSTRLFTMGDLSTVRVEVSVSDRMFGKIRKGQTARITSPSLTDTVLTAEVARISPFLDETTFSARAEIDVPNPEGLLTPGMFVKVDVLYGESQQATLVPLAAIYEDPTTGERGVFVAPSLGSETPVEAPDSYDADNPPPLTNPTPTVFKPVDILAEGRQTAGVRGIEPGTWVVTVGQNLLSARPEDRVDARVRPMPWNRLMALQRLQDRDVLRRLLERQQQMAAERFGSGSSTTASDEGETDASSPSSAPQTTPARTDSPDAPAPDSARADRSTSAASQGLASRV